MGLTHYNVRLKHEHKSFDRVFAAVDEYDAALKFAEYKGHYGKEILVSSGGLWGGDSKVIVIPKPEQPVKLKVSVPSKSEAKNIDLPLVDLALIAKKAVTAFPYDEYEEVAEFLNGTTENRKVISELNEKTRSNYQELVEQKILDNEGASFDLKQASQSIDELTIKAMELGLRSVLKRYIPESSSHISISGGQEIEGKGTWDDFKSKV